MRPPDQVKLEIVRQWLHKADQDLKASEALLMTDPPFLYPACFHAQQAAEKYLKALLTFREIEFPKTHIVEELLSLLQPAVPDAASGLADAAALTPYGVEIRYPGDQPEPTPKEAHQAVELARLVRDKVLPLLPKPPGPER
jgi:HEPN domain-containing protein